MDDRFAIGIEPIAGEGERRAVARLQFQHGLEEGARSLKIKCAQRGVIKHGTLGRWFRSLRPGREERRGTGSNRLPIQGAGPGKPVAFGELRSMMGVLARLASAYRAISSLRANQTSPLLLA